MRRLLFAFVAVGTLCGSPPARDVFPQPRWEPFADRGSEARVAAYRAMQAELEGTRAELAARWREAASRDEREEVEGRAREALERGLVDLTGPWLGTPWAFHGVSEEPGRGQIACGYFVTTLLRDAGLRIERVRLAQNASEYLVRTVAPAERIWRFRNKGVPAVLDAVRSRPERWFVVGLDLHVGLLVRMDDGSVRFCHASFLEPVSAVCEDASTSPAMASRYHVVGALFTPGLVRRWLAKDAIPSVLPKAR